MTIKPPKESSGDKANNLIKAIVESTVPFGGIGIEILRNFIKPPYQKRIEEWQKDVSDALNKLQDKGINLDELQNNDQFMDILFQAIPIAIKNHQQEKRQALKNAIINSANKNLDFEQQQIFLSYIDTFTTIHIKLLILFSNPRGWFEKNSQAIPSIGIIGSIRSTLEDAYHDLRYKNDIVNSIWKDLYNKGLLEDDNNILVVTMSGDGALAGRTTKLGDAFIKFISE